MESLTYGSFMPNVTFSLRLKMQSKESRDLKVDILLTIAAKNIEVLC